MLLQVVKTQDKAHHKQVKKFASRPKGGGDFSKLSEIRQNTIGTTKAGHSAPFEKSDNFIF